MQKNFEEPKILARLCLLGKNFVGVLQGEIHPKLNWGNPAKTLI
jgi:hypothetical protein